MLFLLLNHSAKVYNLPDPFSSHSKYSLDLLCELLFVIYILGQTYHNWKKSYLFVADLPVNDGRLACPLNGDYSKLCYVSSVAEKTGQG